MRRMILALSVFVAFALTLNLQAQGGGGSSGGGGGTSGGGGGTSGGGGGYAGCPAPAPAPMPAPAPAPAPGPGPGPGPGPAPGPSAGPGGGGTTPGGGSGGTTPGGAGGGSPAGGGGPGGGAPGGGGTTPGGGGRGGYGPMKAKRSGSESSYWMGAINLKWEGTFLPKETNDGYAGRELSIDEAVRGLGGSAAWKLRKQPTIVLVYDPSEKTHMKTETDVSKHASFKSAAEYFNLLRIDRRTIKNEELLKELGKDTAFFVYHANADRAGLVKNPSTPEAVVKALNPIFTRDFGLQMDNAIQDMLAVLAREAWVKDEIKRHEAVVICPDCGKKNEPVCSKLGELRKEGSELEGRRATMTRVKPAALTAKSN